MRERALRDQPDPWLRRRVCSALDPAQHLPGERQVGKAV